MYTKEFKRAFKKLVKELTVEEIAEALKISPQEVRRIKRMIGG